MATYFDKAKALSGELGFAILAAEQGRRGTFVARRVSAGVEVFTPEGESHSLQENGPEVDRRFSCGCEVYADHGDCIHASAAEIIFG